MMRRGRPQQSAEIVSVSKYPSYDIVAVLGEGGATISASPYSLKAIAEMEERFNTMTGMVLISDQLYAVLHIEEMRAAGLEVKIYKKEEQHDQR